MKTLISSTEGLLFVILLMVAFALWLQRYKVFRSLGPVLTVVIIGIVLSNTHVVPISHDLYSSISTYCVQAGISICLLSMNVTELKKLNRLAGYCFSICNLLRMYRGNWSWYHLCTTDYRRMEMCRNVRRNIHRRNTELNGNCDRS